eukprot:gene7590-8430_t
MDQPWGRDDFDELVYLQHQKDQQQQSCFSGPEQHQVDQLDLSCMINDFLPNEQYPYNMDFGENLTELSPESQLFIEDSTSPTSTRSPLSDGYSSSNISTQNSPLSQVEEYLYSDNIKKEEYSPQNSHSVLEQQQVDFPSSLEEVNIENADFQMFLQQEAKKAQAANYTGFLPQQLNLTNQESFSFGDHNNQQIVFKNGKDNHEQLVKALQQASEKEVSSDQKQSVVELLTSSPTDQFSKARKQSHVKEQKPKKSSKAKKQKKVQPSSPAQADSASMPSSSLDATVAKSQSEVSSTFSQVVMIPQVVFTNNTCPSVTTQPAVTAYLTSTNTSAMTALPIKILSATSGDVDKIPINPLSKRGSEMGSASKKGEKVERKTNHNEVEKRYRKSITSSLEELKDLVFGTETRSTKAGILKKAMEHIKHLRKINQRLKQENMQLKMAQKQTSLVDLVKSNNSVVNNVTKNSTEDFNEDFSSEEEDEDEDSPMSEDDITSGSQAGSISSPEPLPKFESTQGSAFSMMNKQRFFLSMFMFAFMFLGPSKLLFGSQTKGSSVDYASPRAGGRTILSVETGGEDGFGGYTKLIVNCILYLLFFAWLLIKGEPRYPHSSKQLSLFKTFLKKADNEMKQGDFTTASVYIERGLQVIGRPLSLSKIDMVPSLFWHSLCHTLHQIGLLPLLKNLGWLILPRRLSLNEAVHRYRASCCLAAEAYSKLLDLALLDQDKRKHTLLCAKLAMAAINMTENAESIASNKLITKVYVNATVFLRMKAGMLAYPFMSYYIGRASSALSHFSTNAPKGFSWIFHPSGRSFILTSHWCVKQGVKAEKSPHKDPLHEIGHQFLMYQVKTALKHMVANTDTVVTLQRTENELSLLKQLSHDGDAVAKCWYSIIAPIFYTQYGMKEKAKQAWYQAYSMSPDESGLLACDLYDIIDCYFSIEDCIDADEIEARLQIAEDAVLRSFIFEQGKQSKDELFELLACACAEMALMVRVEHWEKFNSTSISVEQLTKFEQDLNILKELSNRSLKISHKASDSFIYTCYMVEHYSKLLRVMVGSNPINLTKQLLTKKSRRLQRNKVDTEKMPVAIEEMQEAKTLLFVFKHLSDVISKLCPKVCINHLQNAGLSLERCGMTEMTEECKNLLATLQTT